MNEATLPVRAATSSALLISTALSIVPAGRVASLPRINHEPLSL
jgi:hypothetical protein